MALNFLFHYKKDKILFKKLNDQRYCHNSFKIISDERGKVMHMIRNDDKILKNLVKYIFQLSLKDAIKKLGIYIKKILLTMFALKEK